MGKIQLSSNQTSIQTVKVINKRISMGAACTSAFSPFTIPDLHSKNQYNFPLSQIKIDQAKLSQFSRIIFCNNQPLIKTHRNLLSHLFLSQKTSKFKDPNFELTGHHISNLYDQKKKAMKLYTNQNKPGLSLLEQQDVQLAYSSAVMFFLSQNKILLNDEINYQKQLYGFRLFCNGQEHNIIVDDIVPTTTNNDIKYCMVKEKQLWPSLLEKAWCKMIGGYDKAKGLSPEECFEEITGLPASSIRIDRIEENHIYIELMKYQTAGNWLCVVAYHANDVLRPGQVFVIQKLDDQCICLVSPYTAFNKATKQQMIPGHLKIPFHRFRSLFEYLVIGYPCKGYVPVSKKVTCLKRQEKFFEIDIGERQDVSIRFTQFFNGYLNDIEKSNYDYSPIVNFQLYDLKGILHFCQGDDKMYAGAHSVYFTKNIFHMLNKGVYFLRLQVDWERPDLIKEGNIVIYASQNNVRIEQVTQQSEKSKIILLHHKTLENPKSVVIKDENEQTKNQYELRFIQKKTNVLISIQNKVGNLLSLELNFSNSHNFRVRYGKLENNLTVKVNIAAKQIKYLEIMPQNVKKQFRIEPFTVKKLKTPQN